ncbi:MAG: hypothetical protein HQK76_06510 [Desulfobacterales bacterium]|nr:hypothetical protein [Desulfobacterales bacterium]
MKDKVEIPMKDLFRKGLAFKSEKGGTTLWRGPAHIIQFHDGTIVWPEADQKFFDLWKEYMEKEWPHLAKGMVSLFPKPFTRVVPIGKTIDTADSPHA